MAQVLAEVAVAAIKKITPLLAAASSGLLPGAAQSQTVYENDWNLDFALLNYSEEDRIDVTTLATTVDGRLSDDDYVKVRLALDTMSGATPSGETPTENGSTFTGTSGGSSSTSSSSPGLTSFDDTRLEFDGNWEHTRSRISRLNYNAYVSVESDYTAIGTSISYQRDNAKKTKTWTIGFGGSYDRITGPGNGTPEPLSAANNNITNGVGKKNTYDLLVGRSFTINSRTITQLNYSISSSSGYMTDPYKVYSVTSATDTSTTAYNESRPESRQRQSIYWKLVHQTRKNNNIHMSARYYSDDWDVKSLTLDYKHRFNRFNGSYYEPQFRFYNQSKASFYRQNLAFDEATPEFISADTRLSDLQSITLAMKYGYLLKSEARINMRLSYFYQTVEDNFFDTNKALTFDINYSLKFD